MKIVGMVRKVMSPKLDIGPPDFENGNQLQMFWFDGPLDWVSKLCIRSFVRFPGIKVYLYSYDKVADPQIPGCRWMDANKILPFEEADKWRTSIGQHGVPAVSSLFRYQLLFKAGGWYFDTDCLLVRPLTPLLNLRYAFARQDSEIVANGVMKFPKRHRMLESLYEECIRVDPKQYQWGLFGPKLFTKHLKETGLIHKALPPEYFYPIHFSQMERFREPFIQGERTFIVHLWNEILRRQSWKAEDLNHSFLTLGS